MAFSIRGSRCASGDGGDRTTAAARRGDERPRPETALAVGRRAPPADPKPRCPGGPHRDRVRGADRDLRRLRSVGDPHHARAVPPAPPEPPPPPHAPHTP